MSKNSWAKDPAFLVVVVSLLVFLATAFSIFWNLKNPAPLRGSSSPENRKVKIAESSRVAGGAKRFPGGSHKITIDSRSFARWVHFSFVKGIVQPGYVSSMDWDLAFKRYHIIANGGAANIAAHGGIVDLGKTGFENVETPPSKGYIEDTRGEGEADYENHGIFHWYLYDYATHVLTPSEHVYIVRTPLGKYYKMQILNYYCGNIEAGCLTFKYAQLKGDS